MRKTYKHVGKRFIDLCYVCQQLADGCTVCKTEISLACYEDETVICLAIILHKLIYITIFVYDTKHVVSFRRTTLISTIGTYEEIIKRV